MVLFWVENVNERIFLCKFRNQLLTHGHRWRIIVEMRSNRIHQTFFIKLFTVFHRMPSKGELIPYVWLGATRNNKNKSISKWFPLDSISNCSLAYSSNSVAYWYCRQIFDGSGWTYVPRSPLLSRLQRETGSGRSHFTLRSTTLVRASIAGLITTFRVALNDCFATKLNILFDFCYLKKCRRQMYNNTDLNRSKARLTHCILAMGKRFQVT